MKVSFRKIIIICALLIPFGFLHETKASSNKSTLQLTKEGKALAEIIIDNQSTELIQHAAKELQKNVAQISGVSIPINRRNIGPHKLLIAANNKAIPQLSKQLGSKIKYDGFIIQQKGKHIVIAGSRDRGVLYGVYTLLEEELGCRWYTSTVSKIPSIPNITFTNVNIKQEPTYHYREIRSYDLFNGNIAAHLKLNGNVGITYSYQNYKQDGTITQNGNVYGAWCHTAPGKFLPVSLFEKHPEYFCYREKEGKRIGPNFSPQAKGWIQPCFSNPEVTDTITKNLKEYIKNFTPKNLPVWADKRPTYWVVGQNDGPWNCQCPDCKKIESERGDVPSASLLYAVNKVAREFPDEKIATLAYSYTIDPPKNIKAEKNVAIQLVSFTHSKATNQPLRSAPVHEPARENIKQWANICDDLLMFVWFGPNTNLFTPYPDLLTFTDDIKYYAEEGCTQACLIGSASKGAEFTKLKGYVIAKTLWDPTLDTKVLIDDFMEGYYGKAAPYIKQYFYLLNEKAQSSMPLQAFQRLMRHKDAHLSEESITLYKQLFDQAEKAVQDDPAVLLRVKETRLPIMFTQLALQYGSKEEKLATLKEFMDVCERLDIWTLSAEAGRNDKDWDPTGNFCAGNIYAFEKQVKKKYSRS